MSDRSSSDRSNSDRSSLVRRGEAILDEVTSRSRDSMRARTRRVRYTLLPIVQSGFAAAVAWLVATEVIGHAAPFFASIAAVLTLGVSLGQRLRRSVELVVGVALGILVADLLIGVIGRGAWQIGLVVVLAMVAGVLAGGGPLVVNQGAASGILLVALTPGTMAAGPTDRFVDAIVGGVVGLAVGMLLLPVNPVVVVRRAANRLLDQLAETLDELGKALRTEDGEIAKSALGKARDLEESLETFDSELGGGIETARIAPVRWRTQGHLALYVDALTDIDSAVRNVRVLARRTATMLRVGESVDPGLPEAVDRLAESVRTLRNELGKGWTPRAARRGLVDAADIATATLRTGQGFSANVVVAQVRSTVVDLLMASGLDRPDVERIFSELEPRLP